MIRNTRPTARFSRSGQCAKVAPQAMSRDEMFAELVARGFCTAAQAAEAGHPVTAEGRRRRRIHWATSSDPDVRAAFEAGRLQGLHEADQQLITALAQMLGTEKTSTIRAAADCHEEEKRKAERRRRADAGDPELLEEFARDRERFTAGDRKRDCESKTVAERIPPVHSWDAWREFCSDAVWTRIVDEHAAVGRPLPKHLTGDHQHLRVVA